MSILNMLRDCVLLCVRVRVCECVHTKYVSLMHEGQGKVVIHYFNIDVYIDTLPIIQLLPDY